MAASICLNMIVKNEAHVIRRCLASVRPIISSWAIVDTGSTDGTQDIIRADLADIPGELFERPWRNFGANRSEAIELAGRRGDYLLVIDADDELIVTPRFDRAKLTCDVHSVLIEDATKHYHRRALLGTHLPWRYVGVLHEYPDAPRVATESAIDGLTIVRRVEGGRSRGKTDEEKYLHDAAVLEQGLQDEPGNSRYMFYLAQSYRDAGALEKGLAAYRRRIAMGGWDEEVYCAYYEVARLVEALGHPIEAVTRSYLEAYAFRPTRAEPLVRLAEIHRLRDEHALAFLFAERAAQIPRPPDVLFVDIATYAWKAFDEYAIACYWTGRYEQSARASAGLLRTSELPEEERARVAQNLAFAQEKLAPGG